MFFARADQIAQPLFVLSSVFNSPRWRSRWKLYEDFARMVEHSGAILYTVEVAFGSRDFVVTRPDNPCHLQLRTRDELWHKEDAINLLAQRLPCDWQYVSWVDADVLFLRSDWANETLHQLQHFDVVQMWDTAQDLGPHYETIQKHHGFVHSWRNPPPSHKAIHFPPYHGGPGPDGTIEYHPGFAWAFRRDAWEQLGGLLDTAICGAADNHMARGLFGIATKGLPKGLTDGYKSPVVRWQARAERHIQQRVGVVEGQVVHFYHGPKANRRYWDRWKILVECQFDPATDVKRDSQGLWQLVTETSRQQRLRQLLHDYFRQRDEDAHLD